MYQGTRLAPMTLNGDRVYNCEFTLPTPGRTHLYSPSREGSYEPTMTYLPSWLEPEERAGVEITVNLRGECALRTFMDPAGCGLNLISLGDGFICPYCGRYNADGAILCHGCGGELRREPFLAPHEFPFEFIGIEVEPVSAQQAWDCNIMARLNFQATRKLDMKTDIMRLYKSSATKLISLVNNYTLSPSLHLCAFCGQAVDTGSDCPTCGGQRFPWKELIRVDRDCLYCGTHIESGIVCGGCNRRIGGIALEEMELHQ